MRERVYTFGEDTQLVGVACHPDKLASARARPGVLLLNAGLLHRAGPARLNVELARQLSARGFVCLRFDLSGLGDSETRRDQRSEAERAITDIQQAMSFLGEKFELERFVLVGLCSGADNAHMAAIADDRVSGVVLLDPYGYRTLGYHIRHYGPRMLQIAPWVRFVRRAAQAGIQTIARATGRAQPEGTEMFEREFAPKAQVTDELQRLVDRGVNHLLVYSGGVREHYYNHRGQFREMFPQLDGRDRIEVEYFGDADHVYTLLADRTRLIERVCDWVCEHHPVGTP